MELLGQLLSFFEMLIYIFINYYFYGKYLIFFFLKDKYIKCFIYF